MSCHATHKYYIAMLTSVLHPPPQVDVTAGLGQTILDLARVSSAEISTTLYETDFFVQTRCFRAPAAVAAVCSVPNTCATLPPSPTLMSC